MATSDPIDPDVPPWPKERIDAQGPSAQATTQSNASPPEMVALFSGWSVTVQAAAEAYQPLPQV